MPIIVRRRVGTCNNNTRCGELVVYFCRFSPNPRLSRIPHSHPAAMHRTSHYRCPARLRLIKCHLLCNAVNPFCEVRVLQCTALHGCLTPLFLSRFISQTACAQAVHALYTPTVRQVYRISWLTHARVTHCKKESTRTYTKCTDEKCLYFFNTLCNIIIIVCVLCTYKDTLLFAKGVRNLLRGRIRE